MHPREYNERLAAQAATEIVDNSPECNNHRAAGYMVNKTIALTGGAGAKIYDLFTLTGTVELLSISGVFIDVTDTTTVSVASWDVNDGINTAEITKAVGGVNCSGATLNSVIFKSDIVANVANFHNASQVRYHEQEGHKQFQGGILTAKNGAATTVRFQVTQDGATDAQITFKAVWVHWNREVASNLEAV